MGRKWAPETIPTTKQLPIGRFLFNIDDIEERMSQARDGKKPKLGYAIQLTVEEPASFAGRKHSEYFNIGTEQDPNGDDPKTWSKSFGAIDLNLFLRAGKAKITTDIDQSIASAINNKVIGNVVHKPRRDDKNEMDARVNKWFRVGDVEPWVDEGEGEEVAPAPKLPPVKSRPVEEDDDEEEAPKPKKARVPDEAPSGDPNKTVGNLKPSKVKPQMRACPTCKEEVPRSEFLEHVEACEGDDEEE